ncbi:MAG: ABC-2 type transport system permease protein [Myxococcota bacterium]|jgi:ABC-2 type transport system permease protein
MPRKTTLSGGMQTVVAITLTLIIAVLVNIVSSRLFGRVDLTEFQVHAISDASETAVDAMDGLQIQVYISPDMPPVLPISGQELDVLRAPQLLRDKLAEYKAAAGDGMEVDYIADHVVDSAEKAGVYPLRGKDGEITDAGFERKKYVMGVVFNYRGAKEVWQAALQPEVYEFEITKRLLRLKDKADHALEMKALLRTGSAVNETVKACVSAIDAALPKDDSKNPFGGVSAKAHGATLTALQSERAAIEPICKPLEGDLEAAAAFTKESDQFARMVAITKHFFKGYNELMSKVTSAQPEEAAAVVGGVGQLVAIGKAIDGEHNDLVDSPGRRRIGIVCNAGTLCPFPDTSPLVPELIRSAVLGDKQFLKQMVDQLEQINQQLSSWAAQIEQALFRSQRFDVARIDLDTDIPEDIQAILVYGPTTAFTDHQSYQLDQFVMRGGSLVVLLNGWDVTVRNLNTQGQPAVNAMSKNTSNIGVLLETWGIVPTGSLVLEPKHHGEITLTDYAQLPDGRLIPVQPVRMPYEMIVTLSTFDRTSPLVRALVSLTLPFPTALTIAPIDGVETVALIESSAETVTVDDPAFPVLPGKVTQALAGYPAAGPQVVAAISTGTLPSHFAGKTAPEAPPAAGSKTPAEPLDPTQDIDGTSKAHLDQGTGRVLVIASNLGLDPLGRDAIFPGFDASSLAGQDFLEPMKQMRQYFANWENWNQRIKQTQHTLGGSLQLLSNALDWSIQQDALLELRSKQNLRRPLSDFDEADASLVQTAGVVLPTLLFLLIAGGFWAVRRRTKTQRIARLGGPA